MFDTRECVNTYGFFFFFFLLIWFKHLFASEQYISTTHIERESNSLTSDWQSHARSTKPFPCYFSTLALAVNPPFIHTYIQQKKARDDFPGKPTHHRLSGIERRPAIRPIVSSPVGSTNKTDTAENFLRRGSERH